MYDPPPSQITETNHRSYEEDDPAIRLNLMRLPYVPSVASSSILGPMALTFHVT